VRYCLDLRERGEKIGKTETKNFVKKGLLLKSDDVIIRAENIVKGE